MSESQVVIATERIEQKIVVLRGQKVMLDSDLAELYGVETRALNQAVKRHGDRFPDDFMFQLTVDEAALLKSQSVISRGHGGRSRSLPLAFTEQGVAMLSSVLNSPRAVLANIEIMRAFVRLRQLLATHADLARRLEELEAKYDEQFAVVFEALRELMAPILPEPKGRIGFVAAEPPKKPRQRKRRPE